MGPFGSIADRPDYRIFYEANFVVRLRKDEDFYEFGGKIFHLTKAGIEVTENRPQMTPILQSFKSSHK